MIRASKARKLAFKRQNEIMTDQMKDTEILIEAAIEKGATSVYTETKLCPSLISLLEDYGYTVTPYASVGGYIIDFSDADECCDIYPDGKKVLVENNPL